MLGFVGNAVRRVMGRDVGPTILMYHRIAHSEFDPWGIAVEPTRFEQQMTKCKRRRTVLSLMEFVHLHARGALPRSAIAITFDDGYACNANVAAPLLASLGIPATFFITSLGIKKQLEFWWDQLEAIVTSPRVTESLELHLGGARKEFHLGSKSERSRARPWRALAPPQDQLQQSYLALWKTLRDLAEAEREICLAHLAEQADVLRAPRETHRPMTVTELQTLSNNSLFEIGGHTVSHPRLSTLCLPEQKSEIEENRDLLARTVGPQLRCFAYPHGDRSVGTRDMVEALGFRCAVTTDGRHVRQGDDAYCLPRIQALN
jgi:peptidoglycan/xylan/chitin deacetylase (PgdA/CDA1 family)